jgi:hypothetical protein
MAKKIDHLDEDPIIPSQQWVCISFLSPEGLKNCKVRGVKVRGCYATYEEAKKRADQILEFDPNFHIMVGEVGKWLAWDPDPSTSQDQEFGNEKLNELMKSYKSQLEKNKVMEHQRKSDYIDGARKNEPADDRKERMKKRLRKKLEDKNKKTPEISEVIENEKTKTEEIKEPEVIKETPIDKTEDFQEAEKKMKELEEEVQKKKKELEEIKKEKNEQTIEKTELNRNLEKIAELYKSMIT